MLRALVVDDEAPGRRGILAMARAHPELCVVGECSDGHEAVLAIRRLAPDIVFLDIKLPEFDGFSVIERIGPDRMPLVVFVSAHDEYAIDAFQVAAADYLLKPFTEARFAATVQRLLRRVAHDRDASDRPGCRVERQHVIVHQGKRSMVIPVAAIDWIEASDYYAVLHVGGQAHLLRERMHELAARLGAEQFARVHRSAIVNLSRVTEIDRRDATHWAVRLVGGTELVVSRRRHGQLQRLLRAHRAGRT